MATETESGDSRQQANVGPLLAYVCQQIIEKTGATSCVLSSWDRPGNRVTTTVTYAPHPELELPLHIEATDSYDLAEYPLTSRVLQERVALVIRTDDPRADPAERAYLEKAGQHCLLMLPLVVGEEVIGLLEIYRREPEVAFTPAQIDAAWELAGQAALVIEGGHLFAEARREARDLAGLVEAIAVIPSSLDLETVLRNAAAQFVRVAGVEGCVLSQYDPDAGTLVTWVEHVTERTPLWQPDRPGTSYRLSDFPLTAKVLREGIPAVVQADDPQADPVERARMAELGLRSLLMLPIVAYDRTIGLIEMMTRAFRHDFAAHDIALARAIASQSAIAIENARLYRQVQQQLEELRRANEAQTRLLVAMQEISTPVIPIFERVLILPLIGVVDSVRAHQFTERLLEAVRRQRAQVALVDITGVPLVDSAVAHALLQAAESTRLLGAEVVLVGIRAEVAQTLATLDVEMQDIVTKANLQAGIEYALGRLGRRITALG